MPLSPAERERLRLVLERIVERRCPEAIWWFGSRAENRARPKRDFDLLAVLPDGTPGADLDPVRAWSLYRAKLCAFTPSSVLPALRASIRKGDIKDDGTTRSHRYLEE